MIYDDYIDYTNRYENQYGKRTLVLMEVGSFFEIYAIDNETEKVGPDIYAVCDMLNLQVSRKNKSILENSRTNPLMAGFPSHSLAKHVQVLLSNQYTVVLVRQVSPPPNPQREVTEILSPSMQLQPNGLDGNFLMVALWDTFPEAASFPSSKDCLSVGISCVDVSTGATFVYEVASSSKDPNLSIDELVRLYQTYQPRELVLLGNKLRQEDIDSIELSLGVRYDSSRCIHRMWSFDLKDYAKIGYQNAVLRRAYPDLGFLEPMDALHLERLDNARTAFVYMIQFGYEHSHSIISCLRPPEIMQGSKDCRLEYNSAVQLNVISASAGSQEKPLLSWLNRCATAFGSRRFRDRLLQPIRDTVELEQRYDMIGHYLENDRYRHIHTTLKGVMDIERMIRRMKLGTFAPLEWQGFDASLRAVQKAIEGDARISQVPLAMDGYSRVLVLEECSRYLLHDIKGNVFHRGVHPDIDEIYDEHQSACCALESLASFLEGIPGGGDAACKVEYNERDGYSITTTKRRYQALQGYFESLPKGSSLPLDGFVDPSMFSAKPISVSSSTVRIKHPWMDAKSDSILKATTVLQELVTRRYKEFLVEYTDRWHACLECLVATIAEIDICVTCAKNAREYGYIRPVLSGTENGSYVCIKGMRHPILERILEREMYVPNDVAVGLEQKGLLLFGINASGKSSLMKAIGLNVLMAQAGMFVAASHMELAPYGHIFTRIAGMDNIFKGWSTFTVEMLELKNILHRCDRHSLVLGDELCSGTESVSALAIVTAGIEMLRSRGSTFIFATHLHDLSRLPKVVGMDDVGMQHMHIEIDAQGKIIYDRRLRNGSGSSLYGLEVCKGLGMPLDFLKTAHDVRCHLQGVPTEFQSPNKSRYNAGVFMHECKVCGAPATETHHIIPQKEADKDTGMLGHFHKNRAFNLVGLCDACHQKIHHGELHIHGYIRTSDGVELRVEKEKTKARARASAKNNAL